MIYRDFYKKVLPHIVFWVVYLLYKAIDYGDRYSDSWSFDLNISTISEFPVLLMVCYINLYVLMPAFYKKEKYILYSLLLITLVFLGGFVDRFFSWWIWLPREQALDPLSKEPAELWIWKRIAKNSFEVLSVLIVTLVLKLMYDSAYHERRLRAIEKEKFTAEMNLLKAQINPHFFFNTLNSLYSLTLPISKQASDVVVRLSDLMRYMLYDANAAKVLLKNEITHLKNYISIEHLRFNDRLDLSFQYSGELEGKVIAPLLLLPFVENAFKHGISDNAGWITINLNVVNEKLFLKIENSFVAKTQHSVGGLGLNNVKRRLELIYPDEHTLKIEQSAEIFAIELSLKL